MDDKKKKAIAIGAIIALIIILLLLFTRRGQTIINRAAPDLSWSLPELDINLGDLIVPDLGRFLGVSSCGCTGTHEVTTYKQVPVNVPVPYAGTPPPTVSYVRAAPSPSPRMMTMNSTPGPALKPWYYSGGSDGRI
jgi:hypothetical protein